MSWQVSVHKYKYSQDSRRKILKKLWKQGYLKFMGQFGDSFLYEIPDHNAMEEYKKRIKK